MTALLAVRDRSAAALPEKVSVAVTKAAERMRAEIGRLCHTSNPIQAATVRSTVAKLVKGGQIVLRPAPDRAGLVGEFEVDGSVFLAEVPAVYKLAPRAGVEPTTYRLGGGCSIH